MDCQFQAGVLGDILRLISYRAVSGTRTVHNLDETGAPIGVQQKLMRHSNVATTMNVYGNATSKSKQEANSKVVQMVIAPQTRQAIAV